MPEKKKLTFAYAEKSFLGFLRGVGKSTQTVSSYQSDVKTFLDFVGRELSRKAVSLTALTINDLERYSEYLKAGGWKVNTRRRKLLTVRRLFRFLNKRGKIISNIATKLPAPHKVERIPKVVDYKTLDQKIRSLRTDTLHQARDRALLLTLLETGAQVSEVTKIKFRQWSMSGNQPTLTIEGKAPRTVEVSKDLFESIQRLQVQAAALLKDTGRESDFCFLGHNRYGPLRHAITSRGAELLVKSHRESFGVNDLRPRMIRHSCVVHWLKNGVDEKTVQSRLGLKTLYAFRSYLPMIEKS